MIPDSLPIRIDLFSLFILLGFAQGLVLSYFFFSHWKANRLSNLFLGILTLAMSLLMFDVWLGYTNYMVKVLWLVDSTEPLNLLLAPMAYLYIRAGTGGRIGRSAWLHAIPSFLYLVYMCIMIYPQSQEYKYNSYLDAFHPEMQNITETAYGERWMFFPKWEINDLTFVSLFVYTIVIFSYLKKTFNRRGLSFFSKGKNELSWFRNLYINLQLLVIIYTIVRRSFPHDLGDHIIASFITVIVYITSFTVLRKSVFFQEANVKEPSRKYEKSSLTEELQISTLRKLEDMMNNDKPFLDPGFSMPALAKRLGISTHHLSQILNEELKQSFFDFLASYRVREAQRLLSDEGSSFIKIEEIAQMVGYNSKSAFNAAFRKITGFTPSEFKKNGVK